MGDMPTMILPTSASLSNIPVVCRGTWPELVRTLPAGRTTLRWLRAPITLAGSVKYWLIRPRLLVTQICSFCSPKLAILPTWGTVRRASWIWST